MRICGRCFSARRFRAFRGFCGNIVSHGFHRSTQMVGRVNSPMDFTDQHRWLVAFIRPRNSRNSQKFGGAVGSVGMAGCHTLLHLCKSVLSVGVTSQPEGSVCSVRSVGDIVSHGFHRSTQMVGCVNSPTEFTEFTEVLGCCWLRGYGRMPYPPNLCASVRICGRYFSARRFRVFRVFCGRFFSTRRVRSVGGTSLPEE